MTGKDAWNVEGSTAGSSATDESFYDTASS